jgi:hypothetical protein
VVVRHHALAVASLDVAIAILGLQARQAILVLVLAAAALPRVIACIL